VATKKHEFVQIKQHRRKFYLVKMAAETLVSIAYTSVRGESAEEGAVQRLLNPRRIAGLTKFALEGGDYPSCVVLNWVNKDRPLEVVNGKLDISNEAQSAQIIDGQHRIAGLKEAMRSKSEIKDLEIPVALYEGLDTRACADIFISINTEQKPVSKSLVFDLYGVSSEYLVDPAAVRAKDIATAFNEDSSSPYYQLIKFPGSPRMRGGIALSTAVTALKPLVEVKGSLEQVGIKELERQTAVLYNLFDAIRQKYNGEWSSADNPFIYASGFMGALEFFRNKLIDYCNLRKSFTRETISNVLTLDAGSLILQSEVRGQSGSSAAAIIFDRLVECFHPPTSESMIEI
jgi:DNA sulfur modification protein DndB